MTASVSTDFMFSSWCELTTTIDVVHYISETILTDIFYAYKLNLRYMSGYIIWANIVNKQDNTVASTDTVFNIRN